MKAVQSISLNQHPNNDRLDKIPMLDKLIDALRQTSLKFHTILKNRDEKLVQHHSQNVERFDGILEELLSQQTRKNEQIQQKLVASVVKQILKQLDVIETKEREIINTLNKIKVN